jgi:hypothetical protein
MNVPPASKEFLFPIAPTRINKSLPRGVRHGRSAISGHFDRLAREKTKKAACEGGFFQPAARPIT